ncbi:quinol monooxygenase YgiN [Mucilaginibacter sp. SG538B]|uniref:putative quinol monooxygenase n=1 Tax=Mucilaginibacter sp. SG538B TaxID=2587021 RepID=UPI00159D0E43|nr:putative quinol monooxygenase [Mucilaginibacter sp. SG538B]NVM66728.1 quinol monooxygenase YgiN [Mucilaginibacter sp. SG538B]
MDEKRLFVYAKWHVKDGELDTVLSLLKKVMRASVEEEGNLCYKVSQSNNDINTLVLFEGYRDIEAQQLHQSSVHFRQLVVGKIVPLLEWREVVQVTPLFT